MEKLTTDKFIIKAKAIHSDKYDYSQVNYIGSKNKVEIICKEHGRFLQSPNVHLKGCGCSKCRAIDISKLLSSDTDKFINKSRNIHNNKYTYEKTVYINNSTKVIITCPLHGDFEQIPNSHLLGHGCPECKAKNSSKLLKYDKQQFIEKAQTIHCGMYEYNNSEYSNAHSKINITCIKHGDFQQTPGQHLFGQGCPKCRYEKNSKKFRSNTSEFIEKARTKHGNRFDYSKVNYEIGNKKIIIICKEHGEFLQTPETHLQGHGCSICKASKGELAIKAILDKYNIINKSEYILPEVVSQRKFDFYLPDYRILIEFHGIQHYEYIPFLHDYDEDNFLKQKDRDILKKDNAYRFKYKLVEFNYKQFKYMTEYEFEYMVINRLNKTISNKVTTFKVN